MLDRMFLLSASVDEKLYVEDVFSTWLYTGNSSTQTITNGIDLAGKGGLVWIKRRDNGLNHNLFDTNRGPLIRLQTETTGGNVSAVNSVTDFTTSGFTLGSAGAVNNNTSPLVSWTFRKAPKFFDVVTYTGDGASSRSIAHSLGIAPGFIVIKSTSGTSDWFIYHRSLAEDSGGYLNTTNSLNLSVSTTANASTFSILGTGRNALGTTYVAYLFAHDTSSDGFIQCGSYTGNGSATGPSVSLGWEPQWLMIKNAGGTGNWQIIDNMRGMPVGQQDATLQANLSAAESAVDYVRPTSTGFEVVSTSSEVNTNASSYVYMAIRRGPMRTPTLGTSVLSIKNYAATTTSASVTHDVTFDAELNANRDAVIAKFLIVDSLRGINGVVMQTSSTSTEVGYPSYWSRNGQRGMRAPTSFDAWWASSSGTNNHISYGLVRAPGFFDVVAYSGTGFATTFSHNLGVVPELMIVKRRNTSTDWQAYSASLANTEYMVLNSTAAKATGTTRWNSTTPSATTFAVGADTTVNASGGTYIAYLFASCAGVSKVGSYTGNGSSQTVNCSFSSGARFVMIKRTDSTGDWYVWDTTRGIVAGNDPHLSFNSMAVEVTTDDTIDPDSSGFVVNQVAATNVNVSAATYIYLAIA